VKIQIILLSLQFQFMHLYLIRLLALT